MTSAELLSNAFSRWRNWRGASLKAESSSMQSKARQLGRAVLANGSAIGV